MQLPNHLLESLEEYAAMIRAASYHYADDTCKEWDEAMHQENLAWEHRRLALSNCEPALRDELEKAFEAAMRQYHIGYVNKIWA